MNNIILVQSLRTKLTQITLVYHFDKINEIACYKKALQPTYDVDQRYRQGNVCDIALWLGQYHDIALWYS